MGKDATDRTGVAEILALLSEAGARVDKDDLSLLAKMHGWCESLGEAAGPDSATPSPEVCEAGLDLRKRLEEIILAEAQDPVATLAEVTSSISKLAHALGVGSGGGCRPSRAPARPSLRPLRRRRASSRPRRRP